MYFAPEYFNGEIRDGFYVQPLMKRAWAAQLEVLEVVNQICQRHNIKYVAIYGTLLGAVRHKGYIPWDDDLDIAMLREDYVRFSHYAKQELPEDWRLYDCDNYNTLLTRINNGFGSRLDRDFLEKFHGCPFTVGIDIFPLDHLPDDEEAEKQLIFIMGVLDIVGINWQDYETDPESLESVLQDLETITGQHFDRAGNLPRQLLHLSDKVSSMYWDTKTKKVTVITGLGEHPNDKIPLSCFEKIIRIPFENTTIPVVEDYDLMLKLCFGDDYMEPVISVPHEYPFFVEPLKKIKAFLDERGIAMPEAFHIFARTDDKPLSSIIIPCQNAAANIEACLQSLMCQTVSVTSLEIICVASPDADLKLLEKWEKRLCDILTIVQCDSVFSKEEAVDIGRSYITSDRIIVINPTDCIEADYIEMLLGLEKTI